MWALAGGSLRDFIPMGNSTVKQTSNSNADSLRERLDRISSRLDGRRSSYRRHRFGSRYRRISFSSTPGKSTLKMQFNCSAESEIEGEGNSALVKLLEDLRETLIEATKTNNVSLRQSTIASIESVLNQIRIRLNEPTLSEAFSRKNSTGSQRCYDVPTVLREVEKSIRSLREGALGPMRTTSGALPSLKLNSVEMSPGEVCATSIRKSAASNRESAASTKRTCPTSRRSTQESVKSPPEIPEVRHSSRLSSRGSGSNPAQTLSRGSSAARSTEDLQCKNSKRSLDNASVASEPSKGLSDEEVAPAECPAKKSSRVSRMLQSLGSHKSSKSKASSPIKDPVELCARLLAFCEESCSPPPPPPPPSPFNTCTPEMLYEKIAAMGAEGEEFLQNAQDYLNSVQGGRTSRATSRASSRTGRSTVGSAGEASGNEILEMLRDVRQSVANLECKQANSQSKLDPEIVSLLTDVRESLHSPSRVSQPRNTSFMTPDPFGGAGGGGEEPDCVCLPEAYFPVCIPPVQEAAPASSCASRSSARNKLSLREPESRGTEIRSSLNEIRESIQAIENRDSCAPGPEVLSMLTEVRDSIKSLSACQPPSASPQPEVLSALEEIRATIENVEERTRISQEQTNQEVMSMLECVRKSIRSVEASSSEVVDMQNRQLMETLSDMRQSVSRLEAKSSMAQSQVNPEVASLLGDIRSSIRTLESNRESQRSVADSNMMSILQDIKQSLVSIEGRRSTMASKQPSVNMFVMSEPRKSTASENPCGSRRSTVRTSVPRQSSRASAAPAASAASCYSQGRESAMSEYRPSSVAAVSPVPSMTPPAQSVPGTDPYVREALDQIRQSVQQICTRKSSESEVSGDRYSEVRQSISCLQQDMRSLIEKQSMVSGQIQQERENAQLQDISDELADIRCGMKCLIDTIPTIVDAVKQECGNRGAGSVAVSSVHSQSQIQCADDGDMSSPCCKKVLEMLEEMRAESAMDREILRGFRASSPVPMPVTEPPIGETRMSSGYVPGRSAMSPSPPPQLYRCEGAASSFSRPSSLTRGSMAAESVYSTAAPAASVRSGGGSIMPGGSCMPASIANAQCGQGSMAGGGGSIYLGSMAGGSVAQRSTAGGSVVPGSIAGGSMAAGSMAGGGCGSGSIVPGGSMVQGSIVSGGGSIAPAGSMVAASVAGSGCGGGGGSMAGGGSLAIGGSVAQGSIAGGSCGGGGGSMAGGGSIAVGGSVAQGSIAGGSFGGGGGGSMAGGGSIVVGGSVAQGSIAGGSCGGGGGGGSIASGSVAPGGSVAAGSVVGGGCGGGSIAAPVGSMTGGSIIPAASMSGGSVAPCGSVAEGSVHSGRSLRSGNTRTSVGSMIKRSNVVDGAGSMNATCPSPSLSAGAGSVVPTANGVSAYSGQSEGTPVTNPCQLPSTFTLSFVGPQPQQMDCNEPMIITINGRNFQCSRM